MFGSLQLVLECHWEKMNLPIYLPKIISFNLMIFTALFETFAFWFTRASLHLRCFRLGHFPAVGVPRHTRLYCFDKFCMPFSRRLSLAASLRSVSGSAAPEPLSPPSLRWIKTTAVKVCCGVRRAVCRRQTLPTAFMSITKWTALNCFVEASLWNFYQKLFCCDS